MCPVFARDSRLLKFAEDASISQESPGPAVPSPPIALSLSDSPAFRRAEALLALSERLLDLMAAHAPDDSALKAHEFRARLDRLRHTLRGERDARKLADLSDEIAKECGTFLALTRTYRTDREAELIDVVNVLREVVEAVRGDSLHFENELVRSTTAMGRMVEIEDIRELKRALSREVLTLRQTVAERQSREARHYETLTSRVQSLERSLVTAKAEATTDALTQLLNRGSFDAAVREWVTQASQQGATFALAMVDLDDFKRINDTYGHPVGDRVIIAMAHLLRGMIADGEVVSRYGGEEFALLLNAATAGKARDRLTALLQRLPASYEYEQDNEKRSVTFTFSGGVTSYVSADTPESIVKRADEALYDAKRRGKKRVETRPQSFLRGLVG